MKLKLGQQIDALYEMDQRIAKANAVVKQLNALREKMDKKLQRAFKDNEIEGTRGKRGIANVRSTSHPQLNNRAKFDRWVLKHKALDLFQSRVMQSAYFERLEEGQSIPGVEVFTKKRISVVKRKD